MKWKALPIATALLLVTACSAKHSEQNALQAPMAMPESYNYSDSQKAQNYGINDTASSAAYDEMERNVMPAAEYEEYASVPVGGELRPDKIIKTGNIQLATDHFDSDKPRLENLTLEMGGFIERSAIHGAEGSRGYEAVFRVPGDRFEELKAAVESIGRMLSSNESTNDATGQYYDMEGRLNAKRVEESRILELIEKAESVESLLALEQRLGMIRTDIQLIESQMKNIDDLSAYSTLYINMAENENIKLAADTGDFGQKLWGSFKSSASGTAVFLGNVLVILAGAAFPLAILAILAFTALFAYKGLRKRQIRAGNDA